MRSHRLLLSLAAAAGLGVLALGSTDLGSLVPLAVTVDGPSQATTGEPVPMVVHIQNTSDQDRTIERLELDTDDGGFVLQAIRPSTSSGGIEGDTWHLHLPVPAGGSETIDLRGFWSEPGRATNYHQVCDTQGVCYGFTLDVEVTGEPTSKDPVNPR